MASKHKKRLSAAWLVVSVLLGSVFISFGMVMIVFRHDSVVAIGSINAEQQAAIAKIKIATAKETGITLDSGTGKQEPRIVVDSKCMVVLLWAWDGNKGEYQYNAFPGAAVAAPYRPVMLSSDTIDVDGLRNSCAHQANAPAVSASAKK